MDIVRAQGQDPETCRELFILGGGNLRRGRVSVGGSRLKPAAPTDERATVRTDTVKRGPMLRQMRGSRQIPAENFPLTFSFRKSPSNPAPSDPRRRTRVLANCPTAHRQIGGRDESKIDGLRPIRHPRATSPINTCFLGRAGSRAACLLRSRGSLLLAYPIQR
jgi:hypothetical protein